MDWHSDLPSVHLSNLKMLLDLFLYVEEKEILLMHNMVRALDSHIV